MDDAKKTTFIMDQSIYYYIVMPFWLKNIGATYQQLVNTMFRPLIRKIMKVYEDNMLKKSSRVEDHVNDSGKTFDIL